MKRLLLALSLLSGCDNPPPVPRDPPQETPRAKNNSSGLGITTTGKVGIELAPGIVLGFDGKVSPGFGF